jgi:hypothetical protein
VNTTAIALSLLFFTLASRSLQLVAVNICLIFEKILLPVGLMMAIFGARE